jgi:hypothetical protein
MFKSKPLSYAARKHFRYALELMDHRIMKCNERFLADNAPPTPDVFYDQVDRPWCGGTS